MHRIPQPCLLQAFYQGGSTTPSLATSGAARPVLKFVPETTRLTLLLYTLRETGEIKVDHQDVWEVPAGAISLQSGLATGEGHNRV